MIKKIGVITSGGDSPGMNAAIRSVVRTGLSEGLEVYGVYNGYLGLFNNIIQKFNSYNVSDIINRGGTLLGTSRFPEFCNLDIRKKAIKNMEKLGIDALIVIGGDGSYLGAKLITEMGFPCIGVPGTIDNDVAGTDYTIGYFSALETIVEAIDRLRDTSTSHQRITLVEVMGRDCGNLTISAAIASGCEYIIIPEIKFNIESLITYIKSVISNGKKHAIVAITEHICNVSELALYIEKKTGRETRATVLGYIQRGGSPVAYDRILASRMGAYSIKLLLEGYSGHCVGIQNDQLVHNDILYAINNMKRPFQKKFLHELLNTFKKIL